MADGDAEEICDNWEDIEESALEKKLKGMQVTRTEKKPKTDTQARLPIVDDSGRTLFQPQIKILQRKTDSCPMTNGQSSQCKTGSTTKNRKTLEQRESEYAEARQRILGEAYCNSEALQDDTTPDVRTPRYVIATNTSPRLPQNVIRQPTGPDGTPGFQIKR